VNSWPALCAAHAFEQAVGAAVHVVAGDDVRAGRQQFEHGRDGGQAGGEGEGRAAASMSATQRSSAQRVGLCERP
jgi:hypothetical protein